MNFLVGVLLGISGAKSHYRNQVGPTRGPNACLWALGSLVFASKKTWVGPGQKFVVRSGHVGLVGSSQSGQVRHVG